MVGIGAGKPMVAIGPGTGTEVASLAFDNRGAPIVLPGEGGHVDFARSPTSRSKFSVACVRSTADSIERLLCGAGIMNIYHALADIRGTPVLT